MQMVSAVETATEGLSLEASAALGQRLGDAAWMAALRSAAAREAIARLMPTPREREWKYLDVSRLDLDGYEPGGDAPAELDTGSAAVRVVPFERADAAGAKLIERHLGSVVPFGRNKFTALHYAFLGGGVLVNVPANVEGSAPVRISRTFTGGKQLATPHTLIVTGANSRVTVIEDYRSSEADIVALPVVEIVPGPAAEVRYTALHRWGAQTRVFSEQRTLTDRDSAVVSLSIATGGAVVKCHIESSLEGRGSSSELYAVTLGSERQHLDFYTFQDHIGPDTRSDLLFKSALNDESRAVYYGLTRVGLGAHNADANQANRNLLLSKQAKADSDPVLEILTSDVIRVSHGATAGPVDEEQLYYLQARGIPRREAEALLVWGFLGDVLSRVPDETLRAEFEDVLRAKLEAGA